MKFSIIIPTYNSEHYIDNCLKHVLLLDYNKDDFEIIIVDGGSTDNTIRIAESYNARVVPCSNICVSNSRNVGAEVALNDTLVFIDSDCLVNPDLLRKSVGHLSDFSCVGSYYKPSPDHSWIAKTWLLSENRPSGEVRWLPAGTLIVRADDFNKVGGFNEGYIADEDVELCRRMRKHGFRIYNDKTISSIHLGQSDSISKFLEKEMWHASSNFRYLKDYGVKEEKFSVVLNLFFALIGVLLVMSLLTIQLAYVLASIGLWLGASGAFSLIKTYKITKLDPSLSKAGVLFRLFILFNLYLLARFASIFKYKQYKQLFT